MPCTNQHIYYQIVHCPNQTNGHIREITCSFKIIFRARIVKLGRKVVNQSLYGHMKIICKHENQNVFKIN